METTKHKKTCIDLQYVMGFQGRQLLVNACSDAQALQRAIEHFQPKKRERAEVVQLSVEGEPEPVGYVNQ
ncbi:MAG: hypothetical protein ACK5LG_22125 [Bacteroides thetaiotaomicron]